ncbi:DUF6588 family protein [Pedobacter insulae]|uniref:Outer membrane protein beta-barrel domain-containing protein n=1 Tax=Pedobacter insulae TaxID=414048 RepID=A0A1I2UAE1_9SPHI|nr:DUF6588 family protein [Pedobacter insulae]SFG74013.1 hypothetical protein SAMN04489864_10253 [Pedobacter insulae]
MKVKISASLKIFIFLLYPLSAFSQNDLGDLFQSGPNDAAKLVNAYINPLFKGLGVGLNSGWTNTAKTKKTLRFDLRITATAAFVPNSDKAYDVKTLGLENIRPVDPNRSIGPTAFGKDIEGPLMEIYNSSLPDPDPATFRLPEGTGLNFVPSPQVQLTVGLPKHIDVSLRLVPDIKIEDGKLNLFGAGAKFELLPLLMGKKYKATPVDLALAVGYTTLNFNIPLEIDNQPTADQVVDVKMKGYSAEAIVSKKLLFFTPFASIGIHRSSSKLNALGYYEFDVPVTPQTPTGKQTYKDPISLDQTDISGLKASLGFQLNLAFFKIFASYTQAKYSYGNIGIGFGTGK